MEEKKTYTDIEVIDDAVASIGRLRIPVELNEEFGGEITRVWKNLKALLQAMIDKNMKENGWHPVDETQAEPEIISEETVGGESEENT